MAKRKAKPPAVSEPKEVKSKGGRPSLYTEDLAETICTLLMLGWSMTRITKLDEMPEEKTVYRWLAKGDHPFCQKYARAREIQAERMVDEILDISDDESRDVAGELGMPNSVAVQRDKLRTENRKWCAVKLLPKKYGDKVQTEHSGEIVNRVISDL